MAKKTSNSRLKETAFSQYNLRDAYINEMTSYVREIRDEALFSNYGLKVLIRIPDADSTTDIAENQVDEYSNFTNIEWIDTTETVIPLFKEYLQNVSENGWNSDMDGIMGLDVIIPSKLHLPRNSRIVFPAENNRDERIAREWVVLGTAQKQLSGGHTYARVANCVPARQSSYDTSNVQNDLHTIWFDNYVDEQGCTINKNIRANGTIWFVNRPVNYNHSVRAIEATIFEQIPEFPQIQEQIELAIYYDTRAKNIINGGIGFEKGEEFDILDEEGNPLTVEVTAEGDKVPVILTVEDVDIRGSIQAFSLNVEKGYTIFGEDGTLRIELAKDDDFPAIIDLVSVEATGNTYAESLETEKLPSPIYMTPYNCDFSLIGKKVVLSVLN